MTGPRESARLRCLLDLTKRCLDLDCEPILILQRCSLEMAILPLAGHFELQAKSPGYLVFLQVSSA